MKPQIIGTATINYKEDGSIESADFIPSMKIEADEDLINQLKSIPSSTNSSIICDNADLVLGAWWAKMNEIELADREKFFIKGEVATCTRYPSGNVRTCSIVFKYHERKQKNHDKEMVTPTL